MFSWIKNRVIDRNKQRLRSLQDRIDMKEDVLRDIQHTLDEVREDRDAARHELEDFKRKKKREEEDIKHMLKMERERAEVERERFEAKCEREKETAIAEVKDGYRDKMEQELRNQTKRLEDMYKEVLARLPNITARLKGEV